MKKALVSLLCGLSVLACGIGSDSLRPQSAQAQAKPPTKTKLDWHTPLRGPALKKALPQGAASYTASEEGESFRVSISNVKLADGTPVTVYVNTVLMGGFTLQSGAGKIELFAMQDAPDIRIARGDEITIRTGEGKTFLAGKF